MASILDLKNKVDVIYEDADILVVNKPSGLTVIPDRIHTERETVQSIMEKKYGKLFIVHRIDRGTSGLLCFARNEIAHRFISMQFQEHTVQKFYTAIVKGRMMDESGTITAPIAENMVRAGTMLIHKRGKDATTHFTVVEQFRSAAVVSIEIKTGRTHQIRVHFDYIGHPLLVDEIYGETPAFFFSSIKRGYKPSGEEERPTISRLTLHAAKLTFIHPTSQKPVTFEAPLPNDMATVIKLLSKYDQ